MLNVSKQTFHKVENIFCESADQGRSWALRVFTPPLVGPAWELSCPALDLGAVALQG